jgi:protein-tyrosine phosphatase
MLKINYPKECNINHKIINALDDPSYKMTPHFDEAYWFISDGLAKGNVLVHCAAGISRVNLLLSSQLHLF